jgi:hypothetical protein
MRRRSSQNIGWGRTSSASGRAARTAAKAAPISPGCRGDEGLDPQTLPFGFVLDPPMLLGSESGDISELRQDVLEQLKPLARELAGLVTEASDVPARPSQARDQTAFVRISNPDEHYWHRRGRALESLGELIGAYQDHIDILPNQASRSAHHLFALAHGAAWDEDVVLRLDVPELAKPVPQRERRSRTGIETTVGGQARDEKSDPPGSSRRLRPGGARRTEERGSTS